METIGHLSKFIINLIAKIVSKSRRFLILFSQVFFYHARYWQIYKWDGNQFKMPAPHFIKQTVLLRSLIRNSTIIESGTHKGDTALLLTKISNRVITIEPDSNLFRLAEKRFSKMNTIRVIHGSSEQVFPELLPELHGNMSFWLDGHYSGIGTYKGITDSPIITELAEIKKNLKSYNKVCILIDDVRCFNPKIVEYVNYPELNYLVKWAMENNFNWYIEHDIFIAKNFEI